MVVRLYKFLFVLFAAVFSVLPAHAFAAQIFTEILQNKKEVYVGEEFEIKIRLWDGVGLLDVRFLPAGWKNIEIFSDPKLIERTMKSNDVSYHVTDVRLRAVIKKAGRQTFPSLCLQATAPERIVSGKIDFGEELKPPSEDAFKNVVFSKETKEVKTCTNPFEMNVLALPKNPPGLFPATKVDILSGVLPDRPSVTAGTPIKRSVVLLATGTLPGYLPDFPMTEIKNVKFYAGRLENSMSSKDQNIVAALRRTFVYIPEKDGTLLLPEIKVPWLNTETKEIETAVLPAQTIEVTTSSIVEEIQTLRAEYSKEGFFKKVFLVIARVLFMLKEKLFNIKFVVSFAAVTMAAMTILYYLPLIRARMRRQRNIYRLYKACMDDNAEKIEKALILWAKDMAPDRQILTLFDVLTLFQQEDFQIQESLDKLNYYLYGMGRYTKFLPLIGKKHGEHSLGMEIWTAFERAVPVQIKHKKIKKPDLPDLYPKE